MIHLSIVGVALVGVVAYTVWAMRSLGRHFDRVFELPVDLAGPWTQRQPVQW